MPKLYVKTKFKNLKELEAEKAKIKQYQKTQNAGNGSVLNNGEGILGLASSLLGGKSSSKNGILGDISKDASPLSIAFQLGKGLLKKQSLKTILKGAAGTWLKWQAVGLGIKGGQFLYKQYKKKKLANQLLAEEQEKKESWHRFLPPFIKKKLAND